MFWNELWDFIKRNIFGIVLIVTLVVAAPWSLLIFVAPIAILFLLILIVVWRVRRTQQQLYEEARRQAGEQQYNEQSQRSWWRRSRSEGDVTIVQSEPTEQRISDDVGEYVDFKEVKNEETK